MQVTLREEGQSDSLSAHSCGSAGAVGISIGVGGEVVVDDVGCVGKIESAAGEVGGDHDLDFHFAEAVEE